MANWKTSTSGEVPTAVPTDTELKIGNYIAELIPDGATLQIGVGGIPNAVLGALRGHKHLGLHTEAMTDGVLPLLESGVIDNSRKAVMPGVTVASLALGSRRLYDYMDYRKDLVTTARCPRMSFPRSGRTCACASPTTPMPSKGTRSP